MGTKTQSTKKKVEIPSDKIIGWSHNFDDIINGGYLDFYKQLKESYEQNHKFST